MLLGAFPFEHQSAQGADEQRAFNEVHYEQIRMHWTHNPRNKDIVARMSADCRNLLDKVFDLDEEQRITIAGIREHPWYQVPLVEPYASATERLNARQAAIERETQLIRVRGGRALASAAISHVSASTLPNPSQDSGAGIKAHSIKGLVESSCRTVSASSDYDCEEIILKRAGRLSTLLEDVQLHGVAKPNEIALVAV